MVSKKIIYIETQKFIGNWPASLELAYYFFYHSFFSENTIEKLVFNLKPNNEILSLFNDNFSIENPSKAENYIYGLERFIKKDSNLYYYSSNKRGNQYISLKYLTVEFVACSCINCIISNLVKNKNFTLSFWLKFLRFIDESPSRTAILELLKKKIFLKKIQVKLS